MKRLFVVVVLVLLGGWSSYASGSNGVDALRGRWEVQLVMDDGSVVPTLTIFVNDIADADDGEPGVSVANGCLKSPFGGVSAPLALRATETPGGVSLVIVSTLVTQTGSFLVRFTGDVYTAGSGVTDDSALGQFVSGLGTGNWQADHHDRLRPHCPSTGTQPGLFFRPDVHGARNLPHNDGTLFDATTNIVSSAMLVTKPDGSQSVVPFFTDVFSPTIDFMNQFRFLLFEPGLPISGPEHRFVLLDILGMPIPGTERSDVFTACTVEPPRGVIGTVLPDSSLDVSWNPVPITPGFNPLAGLGHHLIELQSLADGSVPYGASSIALSEHGIPFDSLGGAVAPGVPDGFDFGSSLSELPDGNYVIRVNTFEVPAPGNAGTGAECRSHDAAEFLFFTKSSSGIVVLP